MMENNDEMITILISMLPDRVAEYLMTKYEVGVTALDEMEVALQEHMMKIVENILRSVWKKNRPGSESTWRRRR